MVRVPANTSPEWDTPRGIQNSSPSQRGILCPSAVIGTLEEVPFNARSCLTTCSDSVCRLLHEIWEFFHNDVTLGRAMAFPVPANCPLVCRIS